jgi:hypothetical protein
VARIEGVGPDRVREPMKAVFEVQIKKWGTPLLAVPGGAIPPRREPRALCDLPNGRRAVRFEADAER